MGKTVTENRAWFLLTLTVALLMGLGPMLAHHSHAVFNLEHMMIVTGNVTRHAFVNPHDRIYIDVEEEDGMVHEWIITGGPPATMRRLGHHSKMYAPGEQLTVSGFKYRDGRRIMIRTQILRADGEEVPIGGTAGSRFYADFIEKYGNGKDPSKFTKVGKKK